MSEPYTTISSKEIIQRYEAIKNKASEYGAMLVCVTKGIPPQTIKILYDEGHRHFGENRVQEWLSKKPLLPDDIQWHMIGLLQSNKVNKIAGKVFMIHSIDRLSILEHINKAYVKIGCKAKCLMEVHISREETKHGFTEDEIIQFFEKEMWKGFAGVSLEGLMCIATNTSDKSIIRNEFKRLRELRDRIRGMVPFPFNELSMGMSNDWEIALDEGATIIRVGSAIFK